MEPGFLISIFTVIFLVTGYYIWRRDVLYGLVYLFLFIYVIFAQIGYAYFPALSELIRAYFGSDLFYSFNVFITLSFVFFFILFYYFYKHIVRRPAYKVVRSNPRLSIIFYIVLIGHIIGMALYFYVNYDFITYINAYDEEFQASQGLPFLIFGISFKQSVFINLALYFMLRVKTRDAPYINRIIISILFLVEFVLFIFIALKLGNRTDLLSFTLGVVFLEIMIMRGAKYKYSHMLRISLVVVVVICTFGVIEATRSQGSQDEYTFVEKIIYKDYFAPAHILIAAMGFKYVDPLEVIVSNSANSLILLKHPYLQEKVTEIFNPGITTRSSSYAFYIFSEGYLALGRLGFFYNGLVVFLGVSLWKRLSHSNNQYYNLFMLSLMATQVANIARGQSSYFIKNIYMMFLPAMFLFFLGTGLLPWFGRGIQKDSSAIKLQPSYIQ
jgi:hypothetical protein